MNFFEIILLCTALSLDCFTICLIYGAQRSAYRQQLRAGERDPFRPIGTEILRLWGVFSLYHLLMLSLGYVLGYGVLHYIDVFDHWIAFGLLAAIGLKMIVEAFDNKPRKTEVHALYAWSSLLLLGLATSIDAFAVGISLSLAQSSLALTCLCMPFALLVFVTGGCLLGMRVKRISVRAVNVIGGLVLLGIGLRILLEHEYGFSL